MALAFLGRTVFDVETVTEGFVKHAKLLAYFPKANWYTISLTMRGYCSYSLVQWIGAWVLLYVGTVPVQ